MKLTSKSSIIATWNYQEADRFTLYLTADQNQYQQNNIKGNSFTFIGRPASSHYQLHIQAIFDDRLSLLSDIVTITVDSKFWLSYAKLYNW